MKQPTIADIYEKNDKIRQNLKDMVSNFTDEQANFLPEGEKWTLAQFVEHIANAEEGMSKISYKLLSKAQAEGKTSDGTANITANYVTKGEEIRDKKFEAPEVVRPEGEPTIAESLARLDENHKKLQELRPMFESVEASEYTFSHPFMGQLNANEWLALIGDHEARHLKQMEKYIEKIK
jgi:hypothetical protein